MSLGDPSRACLHELGRSSMVKTRTRREWVGGMDLKKGDMLTRGEGCSGLGQYQGSDPARFSSSPFQTLVY